jgi:antitoxin HigA-1
MSKSSITMTKKPIKPAVPKRLATSPGEILLEEYLKPLELSANAVALALRVPANRITGIIRNERAVTADTALRLACYFGTTPEFWLNAQAAYDLSLAQQQIGAKIKLDVRPLAA